MLHRSRYRLLLILLVLVLTAICLRGVASKMEAARHPGPDRIEKATMLAGEESMEPVARNEATRMREGKAVAKLRSLLKVRQGELAMVRIPGEIVASGSDGSLPGPSTEADGPTILHVRNVEQFTGDLEAGVSRYDTIEGMVKTAEGSLAWRSSDLELKGQGLLNSAEETTLQLELRLGDRELVTTFTGKVGSMFLVHPGGTSDKLLVVLGGEKTAADEGP